MLHIYGMNKKRFCLSICVGLSLYLETIGKERDFICDAFPSEKQMRYVYQKWLINEMFVYDTKENIYALSEKGKPVYENLSQFATEFFKKTKPYFQPAISDLAIQYSIFIDDTFGYRDKNTGMFVLSYANQNNLSTRDPFPEVFFPVEEEIENDFCEKSTREIFENKIGKIFIRSLRCEDQNEPCDFVEQDQAIIDRMVTGNPEDKAILFVGFDQGEPIEGSEIFYDTPGYTRSLFWSLWSERPDENHNAIKFCFCKTNEFLEANPQLYGFFDYIVIGGQTVEYITSDVWVTLGSMLKRGGRIVYPDISVDYFPPFLNMMLAECCRKSKGFELYKCKSALEPVYQEIKQLTSFNKEPSHGSFCYANAKTLYWHKKQ